ncbi:hypothetical protein [Pseudotenacibaculum haliotis]|uniref:Adhesin domain-containing protein n=1 Tax=Pseudotenacibaculum haliotis TaxID=1862138 RepID=A0ABW5LT38_9FLAO
MKLSSKHIITAFLLTASVVAFGQKQSKKFTETFNVNKNATVEIEASNAEINVTSWNKNQVFVEAVVEIEGLTKEEAAKYLKNFKFEALGNKNKVNIMARGGNSFRFSDNDFIFFDSKDFVMPEINIPDFNFTMPEINMPEINFTMPDLDWEKFMIDLDDIEFDFDEYSKNGKEYFFRWKDGVRDIKIKSKKDWEKFKKSKEYKEWKKDMEKNREKAKKEMAKAKKEYESLDVQKIVEESLNQAKKAMESIDLGKIMEESMKEVNKAMKEIDREQIKKDLAKVRREFRKSFNSDFSFDSDNNELVINGKKVKIKKTITVKVPKGSTLDLDTRHCKLKLPKMSTSGKVSYGTFESEGLNGGELNIYYAPVKVRTVNNSFLSLKNVTDASLASVTNSKLISDSGDLKITEANSGTDLEASFGEVEIKRLNPSLNKFRLVLNQSDASVHIGNFNNKLNILNADSIETGKKLSSLKLGDSYSLKGRFSVETKGGELKISGKYSELTFIK